jgi:hypothetical protein
LTESLKKPSCNLLSADFDTSKLKAYEDLLQDKLSEVLAVYPVPAPSWW